MIFFTKRLVCVFVGSFVALQSAIWLCRLYQGSGPTFAALRRIQMLVCIQYLMAFLSVVVWNRMQPLLVLAADAAGNIACSVLQGVLVAFLLLSHSCFPFYYVMVSMEPHWLALACLLSYALYAHIAALFTGAHMVEGLLSVCRLPQASFLRAYPKLRRLLSDSMLHSIVALTLSLCLTAHGYYSTGRPLTIRAQPIGLAKLPPAFESLRLVLITDVHIGPSVGRSRVRQVVAQVNALAPDVVAISGDLVDGDVAHLQHAAAPLAKLTAKYGVYYATGNHEYYHGNIDEWFVYLRSIGVIALHNSNRRFDIANRQCDNADRDQQCVCMAGVDDVSAEHMRVGDHRLNVTAALAGCQVDRDAVLLLCHQPKGVVKILQTPLASHIDLILAGHTHGGQMYVIAPVAWLLNKYFLGLYHDAATDTQIYVSAGVNYWGPPVKMHGLNELTLISLSRR